jgi:hypothetical protein
MQRPPSNFSFARSSWFGLGVAGQILLLMAAVSAQTFGSALTGPCITNALLTPAGMILRGTNGSGGVGYEVLRAGELTTPLTQWIPVSTNLFSAGGGFDSTNPLPAGADRQFYRLVVISNVVDTNGAFFVSPLGSDSNSGMIDKPFKTISKGLTAVGSGGLVYLRGGTYAQSSKLSLSKTASPTNLIRLWAYPGETPVIDSTGNTSDGVSISGAWYHLKGLEQKYAGHNGINISGSSNLIENCFVHENTNTGLHITGSSTFPAYNLILNCDSYRNYDPPIGGNADGFSAKWNLGPGNVFSGCRSWENSDDGWDLWMGTAPVLITNCWAFRQGINYWGSSSFNGNGNGFKLGGNYVAAPHRLVHSLAFGNAANGIDQNNNIAGQTVDQNTSWANGSKNFNLNHGTNTTPHVVRNNLSIAGASSDSFRSGSLLTNNSWQVLSPAATTNDVLSADVSAAIAPRQADGSLPVSPFLRPTPGGRLIDRGVYIGEPFAGAAPDLGAYENWP